MKKAIVPLGIIILIIFGIFMYVNRFIIFHISDTDGIIFNTNSIATNLSAGLGENSESVTYESVKVNETIYQSGRKFYIGEETKKNVNLDYPIISDDESSLYVLSDMGNYVDEDFLKSTAYKNTIVTDGELYNGVNYTRVDQEKYIFLELNNGIYVNLVDLNVRMDNKDHIIPVNSFIYFERNFIRYYELQNKEYIFKELPNMQDHTEVYVGEDSKYDYYDLLKYLELLSEKDSEKEEIIEENTNAIDKEESSGGTISGSDLKPPQSLILQGNYGKPDGAYAEEEYVKPVVTFTNPKANVYSYKGNLSIYDPTGRIYKAPTFEYKIKKVVYLRNTFNLAGEIESSGFMPETTYEVVAYYYYYNEYKQKVKNTFYEGTFTTKDISGLETLNMNLGAIVPTSEMVSVHDIYLKNGKSDEVLKGLKTGVIKIGDKELRLNSAFMNDFAALYPILYETDKILTSNTYYQCEFTFFDLAGNQLKIKNNTFDFTTLKSPPKATTAVKLTKNFTTAEATIKIENPDKMEAAIYYYKIYDQNGKIVEERNNGSGYLQEGTTSFEITNLYAETIYTVFVYADYIDEKGEQVTARELNAYEFITYDVARLGGIEFTTSVKDVTQTSATLNIRYTNYSATNPLFDLISPNIKVEISNSNSCSINQYNERVCTEKLVRNYDKKLFQTPVEISLSSDQNEGINIKSNTTYYITIIPTIMSGGNEYVVETTLTTSDFTTLKQDAEVFVKNGFVSFGYTDFDVCVADTDDAIDGSIVTVMLMDSDEKVDFSVDVPKRLSCTVKEGDSDSTVFTRVTAKNLGEKEYNIVVQAPKYNIYQDSSGIESNKYMFNENIEIKGTTGDMRLNSLVNMVNYNSTLRTSEGQIQESIKEVNLFDISNNTRWKSLGHQNSSDQKEIKIESNEVVLQALKGWRQYSYYLPELKGVQYVVSFDFTYKAGTAASQQICLGYNGRENACDLNITSDLQTKTGERLTYIVPAANAGEYLTFFINESTSATNTTTLTLKNVKIEIGTNEASSYTNFGAVSGRDYETMYAGNFTAGFTNIVTTNIDINSDKGIVFNLYREQDYTYVVRYFQNGTELLEMRRIISVPKTDGSMPSVSNITDEYIIENILADESYEVRLGVMASVGGEPRYYDLNTVEFTSEAETRTISTVEEIQNMHMYGYYLVSQDLDFSNKSGYSGTFQGSLDFQGHKATFLMNDGHYAHLVTYLGGGGVIKNLDLHYNLEATTNINERHLLMWDNYGLISNIKVTVDKSIQPELTRVVYKDDGTGTGNQVVDYTYQELTGHTDFSLLGEYNYGTVENIIFDFKEPLYCKLDCAAGYEINTGTIKNIIILGENLDAGVTVDGTGSKTVGILAVTASSNSRIENGYSLVDIKLGDLIDEENSNEYTVGNIVASASSATIKNFIVVDPRLVFGEQIKYQYTTTYRNYNKDVSFNAVTSSQIEDVYYIGDFNFANTFTQEATISHLSNESFMAARLNSEEMFNTVEAWQSGYFPQLKWPETMPVQEQIKVPKKNPNAYLQVLSIDSVIQDKNHKDFEKAYKNDYFARVEMSVYNPKYYKIASLQIADIASGDTHNMKIATQNTGNSDNIQKVVFYIKEPAIAKTTYHLDNIYLNDKNANNNITGITKSCNGGTSNSITVEFDCDKMPDLTLDIYKYVNTIDDIKTAMSQGHQNFRLSQDLELGGVTNTQLGTVSGVLDGDGHTIDGLNSNNCFVQSLTGTIKNLNVNRYTVNYAGGAYAGYGGLVCTSTGGIVDNVHIKGMITTAGDDGTLYVAGMIGKATNTDIRNSSVSDLSVNATEKMKGKNAYAGGMVAYSSSTNISNSFVRRLNFVLNSYVAEDTATAQPAIMGVSQYLAAGGMIGKMESGIIENVYATGEINTKFGTTGGIVGVTSGYIRSAISRVNIYTIGDAIGGIVGNSDSDNTNLVSKTLVMGDILTSAESFSLLDRTSGKPITANQNFAWNRQSINSVVSANTKIEELLNDDELANPIIYNSKIGLSELDFAVSPDTPESEGNYKKRKDENGNLVLEETPYGIVPKILHTTTREILNNQDVFETITKVDENGKLVETTNKSDDTIVHYVELFSLQGTPTVTYKNKQQQTVTNAWDGAYVEISMEMKNPNKFNITEVYLEDLEIVKIENGQVVKDTSNYIEKSYKDPTLWKLTFKARATLNKNYDSYKITGVRYEKEAGSFTTYRTAIKLVIPFYGRIETAADWQSIKAGTYQNFVLANDVDLSAYSSNNANVNISFNKLIGLDVIDNGVARAPVLSGITRTGLSAGGAVIDTIVSEIRNVSFKNISLQSSKSGNYFAVIKFLNGKMQGTLDQASGKYKRMIFDNIKLDAPNLSYVAIIGYNKCPDIHYVEYKNVIVTGKSFVGGLIGRTYAVDKTDIIGSNIYVKASGDYIGGLYGYENHNWSKTFTFNVDVTGVYVESTGGSYVGGAYGYGSGREVTIRGSEETFNGVKMNYVRGRYHYVGGVAGQFSSCYPYYNYAYSLSVNGDHYVGGVCGYRWNCYYAAAIDCDVTGNYYVGGISGWSGYTVLYSTVAGGGVHGYGHVGGISGGISWAAMYDCHVGQYNGEVTRITGRTKNASGNYTDGYNLGGLVGYLDGGSQSVYNNSSSAIINGSYSLGGAVGYSYSRHETSGSYQHRVYNNLIANTTITSTHGSHAFTGGLIGRTERNFAHNFVYNNTVSATITVATTNYSGYMVGGSNYSYTRTWTTTDEDGNKTNHSEVISFNQTKGDKFCYQGSASNPTSRALSMRIYEDSTLNGVAYKNASEKISTNSTTTLTLAQLKSWTSGYNNLNTGRMYKAPQDGGGQGSTTSLGYFPYMRYAQLASNYPNKIDINLPGTANVMYTSNDAPMYHMLPDFEVYAVDVDKINIEFKEEDPYTELTVNGASYIVDRNTFTFYYDFKEDFNVTISDKYNSKTVNIKAEDVKNGVSVIGEYYYYLKDGEVITNNENGTLKTEEKPEEETEEETEDNNDYNVDAPVLNPGNGTLNPSDEVPENNETTEEKTETIVPNEEQNSGEEVVAYNSSNLTLLSSNKSNDIKMRLAEDGNEDIKVVDKATNIYGTEILLDDKNIYDLKTGEIKENNFENLTLTETEPLYEYIYANQEIETFYNYSIINGERINKQIYVKNGQIEIVESGVDNQKNLILVDNYNDKNYLVYLGTDGKLHSLKDDITFPSGFKNVNIKSMSTNVSSNTDILFVQYEDDSHVVFNYRTGQLLSKHSDTTMSLEEYVKQYLEISKDSTKVSSNKKYEEAKDLVSKLNQKPISSFTDGDSITNTGSAFDSKKYSIVYDPSTKEYYVYEVPGSGDSGKVSLTYSLSESVDSKIDANPQLIEFYRGKTTNKVNIVSAILIIIGIIFGIVSATAVLGKNIQKSRRKDYIEKEENA